MKPTEFVVTEDHIKLLNVFWVDWQHCEFGAPAIDCKRPYGNSDVVGDIAEILGWEQPNRESEEYEDFYDKARKIHAEMQTVLQILVVNCTKGIQPGNYTCERYKPNTWRPVG